MSDRVSLLDVAQRPTSSRGTIRSLDPKFGDKNVLQVHEGDVHHSESPTEFEFYQPPGVTTLVLDQDKEEKQQQQKAKQSAEKSGADDDGLWNHDQPKGKSAEFVGVYLNGHREHLVGLPMDRRIHQRLKEKGEACFADCFGSGQMLYHKKDGAYLISLDGKSYGKDEEQTRMVSLRHVNKPLQPEPKKKQQGSQGSQGSGSASAGAQQRGVSAQPQAESGSGAGGGKGEDFKYEGNSVNTEVRVTKGKISFYSGENEVGFYDKQSSTWHLKGTIILEGTVKLGSPNASKKVHRVGDKDDDNDAAVEGAATVFA